MRSNPAGDSDLTHDALGQIYGSIEAQHQKSILVDFIDHLADFDRFGRADQVFAQDKSIAPLSSIMAVQNLPQTVKDRLYFVKFEDLVARPVEVMSTIYDCLGVAAHKINTKKLAMRKHESDSHYRFKYLHQQMRQIGASFTTCPLEFKHRLWAPAAGTIIGSTQNLLVQILDVSTATALTSIGVGDAH